MTRSRSFGLLGLMFAVMLLTSLSSCAYPSTESNTHAEEVFNQVKTVEQSITFDEVASLLSSEQTEDCFLQADLNNLIQWYGFDYSEAPDVAPCFNNYYQDIFGGGDSIANVSLVNGERIDLAGPELQNQFTYQWYWNDSINDPYLLATGYSPSYSSLNMPCDGAGFLTLRMTHTMTGAVYERTEIAFISFTQTPDCDNGMNATDTQGVFSTVPPDGYEEFSLMVFPHYIDNPQDRAINTADLTNFLPQLCGS